MGDTIELELFKRLLREKEYDAAKELVTPQNINARLCFPPTFYFWQELERNVIACVCYYCEDDDVGLLQYFLAMGPLQLDVALRHAIISNKPKMTRVLMNILGPTILTQKHPVHKTTPLHDSYCSSKECGQVLIDFGATPDQDDIESLPNWVYVFSAKREAARMNCTTLLGLHRRRSIGTKDTWRIIARCVWATRCNTDVWRLPK